MARPRELSIELVENTTEQDTWKMNKEDSPLGFMPSFPCPSSSLSSLSCPSCPSSDRPIRERDVYQHRPKVGDDRDTPL